MNRRGFLQSILAAGVAPAFIGSGILMPVRGLWKPKWPGTEWVEIDFNGPWGVHYPYTGPEHWLADAIRSGETVYWQDITMTLEEYMQKGRGTYRDVITPRNP